MQGEDISSIIISSPVGKLELITDDQHLQRVNYLFDSKTPASKNLSPLQKLIVSQLENYFADPAFHFSLPLLLKGTDFQKQVWKTLAKIPTAKTWTYGELAEKLHTHPRAVGQACKKNPVAIIIPCHRVVSATDIGGYSGATDGKLLHIKKWLLQHENQSFFA